MLLNSMQKALIKKDFKAITSNKRLFPVLIVVPLVMTIVLPTIFILTLAYVPLEGQNYQQLLALLPKELQQENIPMLVISLIMNNIIPLFFLLIPIMAASVMAASSFVGEKEKKTLETLLYSPLTLKEIFNAKVVVSFLMSMFVSFISFVAMLIIIEIEIYLFLGAALIPDISWLIVMVLIAPPLSIISITLIVRGSAKAQTSEESQQRSVFLVIPLILLIVAQFSGILLLNVWMLLVAGVVFVGLALILLRRSFFGFTYEKMLQ